MFYHNINPILLKVAKHGSVQSTKGIPKEIKRIFVTAHDIKPDWHVKMQAIFQRYTDNGVNKTINLKHSANIKDVKDTYQLAYKLKCKGITVYRYGCKKEQVLYITPMERKKKENIVGYTTAESEYAGGCRDRIVRFSR